MLGEDIFNTLQTWKQSEEIEKIVNIVCIARPGYDIEDKRDNILFISKLNLDISSSIIRENISSKNLNEFSDVHNMIDKDVFSYILNNGKTCQH